jgi:hypothetical protein
MAELLPEDALHTSHDGQAMDELDRKTVRAQRPVPGDFRQPLRARARIDADAYLTRRSA